MNTEIRVDFVAFLEHAEALTGIRRQKNMDTTTEMNHQMPTPKLTGSWLHAYLTKPHKNDEGEIFLFSLHDSTRDART